MDLDNSVKVLCELAILFLDDLVDLILSDLELLLVFFYLGFFDTYALFLFLELALLVFNLFEFTGIG